MAAHSNAGLAFPPGLDVQAPTLATSPVAETGAAPIGVWALEAKLKAEQTQARQQEWAEKMQLQYLRGQEVLKALNDNKVDQAAEDSKASDDSNSGSAFDRLVKQFGLASETPPRCSGQKSDTVEETPPKQLAWDLATPTKGRMGYRKAGEKENLPSPTGRQSPKAESDRATPARRSRGGRRARGAAAYQ
jgi:hypothetical protein